MVVFFTVAPFNNDNLLVFRHFADEVLSEQVADTERKRRTLERSKDYVRSRRALQQNKYLANEPTHDMSTSDPMTCLFPN